MEAPQISRFYFEFLPFGTSILYIKANVVCVHTKIGQCLEDSSSHCPFPVVTNRTGAGQGRAVKAIAAGGRAAKATAAGGRARCHLIY